jgi:hypothetical protein
MLRVTDIKWTVADDSQLDLLYSVIALLDTEDTVFRIV